MTKQVVAKRLFRARRRPVRFAALFNQGEVVTQQFPQAVSVVLHDRKPAAFGRTAGREAGDHDPAVGV